MDGKFRDGTQMTYGGSGYNTGEDEIQTNYMFNGDPGYTEEWTEISESNPPADRRCYGSMGPFNLNAGEELCIEYAYVFAQAENIENNLSSVYLLKNYVVQLNAIFSYLEEEICLENKTGVLSEAENVLEFNFCPNPSSGEIIIQSAMPADIVFYADIFNINGQRINNYTFINEQNDQAHYINLSALSTGIYFIRFEIERHQFSEKLIIK